MIRRRRLRSLLTATVAGLLGAALLSCSLVFPVPDVDADPAGNGASEADATNRVDGAAASPEPGSDAAALDGGGVEASVDFTPPVVPGLSGIAVIGNTLFAGSTQGVLSCALPDCSSLAVAYPEATPATMLTAGAQHLGWVVTAAGDDVPTVQVADGTGAGSEPFPLTGGGTVEQIAIVRDAATSALLVVARRNDGTSDVIGAFGDGEPAGGYPLVSATTAILGSVDDVVLLTSAVDPSLHRWVRSSGTWTEELARSGDWAEVLSAFERDAVLAAACSRYISPVAS
jgi:hypothetical protein